jgi:hypothetical protein
MISLPPITVYIQIFDTLKTFIDEIRNYLNSEDFNLNPHGNLKEIIEKYDSCLKELEKLKLLEFIERQSQQQMVVNLIRTKYAQILQKNKLYLRYSYRDLLHLLKKIHTILFQTINERMINLRNKYNYDLIKSMIEYAKTISTYACSTFEYSSKQVIHFDPIFDPRFESLGFQRKQKPKSK